MAEFLAVEHGTAYLGYSASGSQHARLPFFASSGRAGGPAKGDIQLFTVRKDTTLRELLRKVGAVVVLGAQGLVLCRMGKGAKDAFRQCAHMRWIRRPACSR